MLYKLSCGHLLFSCFIPVNLTGINRLKSFNGFIFYHYIV